MDQHWLSTLNQTTGLIVPTRSLAATLNEQFAQQKLAAGRSVWEAPNIFVWSDYLRLLWYSNRDRLSDELQAHTLISTQQSLLAWTQVVEASRHKELALTLLNVQQTARAVQRSWQTMHDWQISLPELQTDHVADTDQFAQWVDAYERRLQERKLIDESQFVKLIGDCDLVNPFERLLWFSYDLVTAAQRRYLQMAESAGMTWESSRPDSPASDESWQVYPDTKSELRFALERARSMIEHDKDHTVSIVVPDLQHRQRQVEELARDVFYPSRSPLEVQQGGAVYQFSLGQKLHEMPAVEAALSAVNLLKNRVTTTDIGYLLRNRYLGVWDKHQEPARLLASWLLQERVHNLLFDHLPDYYLRACDATSESEIEEPAFFCLLNELVLQRRSLEERLGQAKDECGFAALQFADWVEVITQWLEVWHWRTGINEMPMSSVQYQLLQRWQSLLQEFSSMGTMQRRAGLRRALELMQQMARNTIFLPKSANSPVTISGVLEAIGRETDSCFLTGMHQGYPAPWQPDAFVPTRLLAQAGHPDASVNTSYTHSRNVISHLLECANNRFISYAKISDQDQEVAQSPSPLFNDQSFAEVSSSVSSSVSRPSKVCDLESYSDQRGPDWNQPGRAKGGASIFENQSLCAFKAFATHQLGFTKDDEAEFGLDGLDRGNVVHHLLNLIWAEVQTQQELIKLDKSDRADLIERVIATSLADGRVKLTQDKLMLLKREHTRLKTLLLGWLELEAARPERFAVVEREERREGELAGIRFRYIIDRVDVTEDGRSVIIDYKTGITNRKDWLGERLKSPQMPLYCLALDELKAAPASGIAFAQVKQGQMKFVELAEAGIFKTLPYLAKKHQLLWEENRPAWPQLFEKLAEDFLAGEATVDPLDAKTCDYCGLHSLCRLPQLIEQRVDDGS